jgi:DNA-binding beta-propeller fold protein YncE
MNKYVASIVVLFSAAMLSSQPGGREQPGPQPGGFVLLPNGWSIQPAGEQIPLDTMPMSTALSPDGRFLLVLNGGYRPPSISVMTVSPMKEIARVPVADAWLGLTFAPGGKLVYASGGSRGSVLEFSFSSSGELKLLREMQATAEHGPMDFIGDVAMSPDGHLIYAAELLRDAIVVINPQSGRVIEQWKTGRRPYRILFAPGGKSFFVSSWADASVYLHNATNGELLGRIGLGPHTTDMILSARKTDRGEDDEDTGALPPAEYNYRLFVAAANTNSVYVVGVGENNSLRLIEVLNVALTSREPAGMTPSSVALAPDQKHLFVACSDANAVAVADISASRSQVEGFIPAGWYPTAVRALEDGRLVILNGRGSGSHANPGYGGSSQPRAPSEDPRNSYVAAGQTGTMSVVRSFSDDQLDEYTATVIKGARYRDADLDLPNVPEDSVIYSRAGRPSPIEHVVYIIKENRTYDQVFGKIGKGNGDPSLTLFDESAAPNHYKLAREFVLFDNFYVNADVSADGHNWSTAAIAPDFAQRLWPSEYAHRLKYYGFEGFEPANLPPAGYLWTNALAAGLTVRNFGEWSTGGKVGDPALEKITDKNYKGWDLDYPDVERAKTFIEALHQMEAGNAMPKLTLLRLPNDHTSGTSPGKIAPLSAFADNDAALGMIVEAISHSKFWPTTAIFVLEDDAQDGPDHVDSHRSVMLAISPYMRRGIADSTMYNTTSVLRTMELILGLRPMTHFDAGARPLSAAFATKPDTTSYVAEKPHISLTDRNPERSPTAERSRKLDFSQADRVPDDELNAILWLAIKGTEPPAPSRSYFSR